MSDHYYSEKPHSELKTEKIHCTIRNHSFVFTTGSGVFSKKSIDFGTRLLIETFAEPSIEGPILDLGCGYGPIGITLANEFDQRSVIMCDINERAVALTKENIAQNNIENAQVIQSDGFSNIKEKNFAVIITNPPIRTGKKMVYGMLEKSKEHLRENGELWLVVQKKQGAPSMISFLETIFSIVEVINRKKGYHIVRAIKQ